jgi:hypothetical protein
VKKAEKKEKKRLPHPDPNSCPAHSVTPAHGSGLGQTQGPPSDIQPGTQSVSLGDPSVGGRARPKWTSIGPGAYARGPNVYCPYFLCFRFRLCLCLFTFIYFKSALIGYVFCICAFFQCSFITGSCTATTPAHLIPSVVPFIHPIPFFLSFFLSAATSWSARNAGSHPRPARQRHTDPPHWVSCLALFLTIHCPCADFFWLVSLAVSFCLLLSFLCFSR